MKISLSIFAIFIAFIGGRSFGSIEDDSITNRLDYVINEVFLSVPEKTEDSVETPDDVILDAGTFIEYYLVGNNAYLHNDWLGCAYFFEKAIQEYKEYSFIVANCRINCEYETNGGKFLYPENPENIHFYDSIVRKTLCLKKCLSRDLTKAYRFFEVDDDFREIFHSRKPYEYLQLCHYKNGDLNKAVAAAATILAMNPDHKLSLSNLKYYTTQEDYQQDFLIDQEAKRFAKFYQKGMDLYRDSKWMESIEVFEKSLETFMQEENMCRAFCEGSFNQGWHPDFVTSTANHFTYCLRCKRNCTMDMSIVGTNKYPDIFPSHYEYLQFSYFKAGNIQEAVKCAVTYLLFFPNHEIMLENLEFYKKHPEAKEEDFIVRKEALEYYQRTRYEKTLLGFINVEFTKFFEELKDKDEGPTMKS